MHERSADCMLYSRRGRFVYCFAIQYAIVDWAAHSVYLSYILI